MKKNIRYCFLFFSLFSLVSALSACQRENNSSNNSSESSVLSSIQETKYMVSFDLNGGSGTAPTMEPQMEGAIFTLPGTSATKENYTFSGWKDGSDFYTSGSSYTMPSRDVTFLAHWERRISKPCFSKESYTYDRVAAGDLELPINLDGAGFYYLDVDEGQVPYDQAYYDEIKSCIVVKEDYVLNLGLGEHYLKAITDGDEEPAKCVLHITNSIKTNFDTTTKLFKKGYMDRVEFDVDFNETTIIYLKANDMIVDPSYYGVENNKFYINATWLSKFYGSTNYSIMLSNHDKYDFTIDSNVVFYTDYDVTTIHDTLESTIGHNPLYQYSTPDSVSIVEGVEGMNGKVLKYVPNYVDVPLDCNGIFTIKSDECPYMWYNANLNRNKNYAVSFDYMTVDTTVGEFRFRAENNSWSDDLLIGPENDNVVHHYTRFVEGKDVGYGFFIKAFFKDGSGHIYIDNFSISEVDNVPSISPVNDYRYNGSISTSYNNGGLLYEIRLDGAVSSGITASDGIITIDEETASSLVPGKHTLSLVTPLGEISTTFKVIEDLTCEFVSTEASFDSEQETGVRYYGNFGSRLQIASVKQVEKNYDAGYGGWDFVSNNVTKDYKEEVTLREGTNNQGYIEFSKKLCESVFGTTQFEVEYTNGDKSILTLNNNIEMLSDYDNTSLLGYFNGGYASGSPLNSGLWGASQASVKEYEEGNNGLSITSTEGSADQCAFSVKYHDHTWDWFKINGQNDKLYRTRFTYRITNLSQDSVYFYIMTACSDVSKLGDDFFGQYDQADYEAGDNYYKVRYNLIADGQLHEFDSGYYTYSSALRMTKIKLPYFTASDNGEVLIDNYRVDSKSYNDPISTSEFLVDNPSDISFTSTQEINNIKVDNSEVSFTKNNDTYTLNSSLFTSLEHGNHTITLDYGNYKVVHNIIVTDSRDASLSETSKVVTYQGGSIKLSGNFSTDLTITSLKRHGTHDWDNTTGRLNSLSSSDGSMNPNYITIEEDGLVISSELIDQCYGEMRYTVEFSNKKLVEFTLTSNMIYYSNFNETLIYVEFGPGVNGAGCQDYTMSTYETIDGKRVLRYTPSNAILGHALNADNRILTFSIEGKTSWWWTWSLGEITSESKIYFTLDYAITGDCDGYYFCYWDNAGETHSISLNKDETSMYLEINADDVVAFAIGCSQYGSASAGSYMDIYAFGFGIK